MRKIFWLIVSSLMVLSLVIAACGPAATPPAPTTQETTTTPVAPSTPVAPTAPVTEKPQQEAVTPAAEKPQYGGLITLSQSSDTIYFDEGTNRTMSAGAYTHEELSNYDWTKGPTGNGEILLSYSGFHRQDFYVGMVAESWEYTPPTGMVLHIRQGIHFGLNPAFEASRLVNGRELTADDVVLTFKRLFTEPMAYLRSSYPAVAAAANVTASDKYTVEIKCTPETFMDTYHTILTFAHITAPEVVKKYGNLDNWRNMVGTGPFMINEYVPGSLIGYIRNPNYWMKNPMGPGKGDRLPYIDGFKILTIPDQSTRYAALRTGKVDQMTTIKLEDKKSNLKYSPDLKLSEYWSHGGNPLAMKIYDPKLPFKDARVRRAMIMAIDYQTIVKEYYGGAAEYFNWPNSHLKDYENIWIPLEEMPASVQELYTYNPEKAKQLLKEAGYPNGFKTTIVVQNILDYVDYMSVIKDMWSKVGIELILEPKETAVYTSLWRNFTYPEMCWASAGGIGSYYRLLGFSGTDYWNPSQVNEPYIEEVRAKIADIFSSTLDWKEIDQLYRDLKIKVIDQAYMIPSPTPHNFTMWWPWIKNYNGETNLSFAGGGNWEKFVWIDRDLKETMGH